MFSFLQKEKVSWDFLNEILINLDNKLFFEDKKLIIERIRMALLNILNIDQKVEIPTNDLIKQLSSNFEDGNSNFKMELTSFFGSAQ